MPLITPDSEELGYSTYLAFARLRELVTEVPADLRVGQGDVRAVVAAVASSLGRRTGLVPAPRGADVPDLVENLDAQMTAYMAQFAPKLGAASRGTVLGELILAGYDVARAAGRRWPIEPADMAMALSGLLEHLTVPRDPAAAVGVRVSFVVRLREATPQLVRLEDGSAEARDLQRGDRADVVLGGRAVPLGLMLHGRISCSQALVRGARLSGGRRPWRAWSLPPLVD